jgi:hypothetical protein
VPRVAERVALGEGEDSRRLYREDFTLGSRIGVPEAAVVHRELPPPVPFALPSLRQSGEYFWVRDLHRIAFNRHVNATTPLVAAGDEDNVRIGAQIEELLLRGASREVERTVDPHRDQRRDMRAFVSPYCADPEQFRGFEQFAGLLPTDGDRRRVAEARIKGGHRAHGVSSQAIAK